MLLKPCRAKTALHRLVQDINMARDDVSAVASLRAALKCFDVAVRMGYVAAR
jgi:hypothetical protein